MIPAAFFAVLLVIDGDTVRAPGGEALRLAGIDAPETGHRARCPAEAALARAASARMEALVSGGAWVIWDGSRGRWGRPLIALRLPDGRDAGAVLIEEGLAVEWRGARADWCAP
ncbi:hypothetical protein vBDshSR4C_030 [Dinoroseobacter phage vB_DshS-R4C]|nr:hypothetical protein vBDshSR4C_030 [Dinoroseobacter phage vB_DshS-R4C]